MLSITPISHSYAKDTISILLFGDSIVAGYGLSAKESLAYCLQNILDAKGLKVKVINGGISGNTTNEGKNRLIKTLDQYKPNLVVLALGGNDMLRGIAPNVVKENLDSMLNILNERKIATIFQEVFAPIHMGIEYANEFNKAYEELAEKYKLPLYPFFLKKIYSNPSLMQSDGIHPSAKGIEIIAEDLAMHLYDEISKK
jgi:acyl-CoA thioesterase-1